MLDLPKTDILVLSSVDSVATDCYPDLLPLDEFRPTDAKRH